MSTDLSKNAIRIREEVRIAAEKANRDPSEITIVAVSKTFERALMDEAYQLGFRVFGESRVQEIRQKCEQPLPEGAALNMIGPLQTNKIRQLLPYVNVLETVDRPRLIEALAKQLENLQSMLDVMMQVNISGEGQKSGVSQEGASALMKEILTVERLRPTGLMTMAPYDADESTLRRVFGGLKTLRDQLQESHGIALPALSMGMSGDFEIAIAEGSTHIRIGRGLFGRR